jgi:transposase-like protein
MWSYHTTASRRFRVNECTLPTYREAALCRHIDVHQSQSWSWIHHATDEQALSPLGRMRLSWLRWHVEHGGNKSLTCRHFAIGRPTLDRWLQRYQRAGLRGLEDRSRRPHRVTPPTWTTAALLAVAALREQYPYMGKAKLRVLLLREGHACSVSMVGRMLHRLRLSGQLHEPVRLRRRRGRSTRRPHAIRKPKDYVITAPGDLVQIDTLDVAVAHGSRFLQLSLVDVYCRWTAAEVRRGKAALTMRASLSELPVHVSLVEEACVGTMRVRIPPWRSPSISTRSVGSPSSSRTRVNVTMSKGSQSAPHRSSMVLLCHTVQHESCGPAGCTNDIKSRDVNATILA